MKVNLDKARAFADRKTWRSWLEKNHTSEQELWLVYYKNSSGKPTISYDESVEEALCFGWIDGIIQKIDEEKFARRFTPRRAGSRWSLANIARMKKLQEEGLLHASAVVPDEKTEVVPARQLDLPVPDELARELKKNSRARKTFKSLTPSHRREYLRWVTSAKREETRERRAKEAARLLAAGTKALYK
jgi:uncharacterized protein YdeI (YjbR/CyaY-like superfamily)